MDYFDDIPSLHQNLYHIKASFELYSGQLLPALQMRNMSDTIFHALAIMRRAHYVLFITASPILNTIIVLSAFLILNYILAWVRYHVARRNRYGEQLPPKYPTLVPFFGDAISSAWDLEKFLHRAT